MFNRDSAYVLQDDVHFPSLTVEETIRYSAWTRMPEGTSEDERERRVEFLVDMMELGHVKHSRVGDAMSKGISGGQAKRLSIAVEIVSLPNLIFLDEPTSGLDSAIALEVMTAVRKLANDNRTCITTIHQPSPEVFDLFDRVILLSNGKLLYSGSSKFVTAYFSNIGYSFSPDMNPAEFIIDICSGLRNPDGQEYPLLPNELEKRFKDDSSIEKEPSSTLDLDFPLEMSFDHRHATRSSTQLKMLFHRGWTMIKRDPADIRIGVVKNIIVGTMTGVIFFGQADVPEPFYVDGILTAEASSMCSLLFFTMMYCLMSNLQAVPSLCSRDLVYRRELASYSYSPAPYWLSSMCTYVPIILLTHTVYVTMIYTLCGFPADTGYFFYYYFLLFVTNLTAYCFTVFLAAATGSAQMALAVFSPLFFFLAMFGGFTIAVNNVPKPWIWAPIISFARWSFEGLMVNEFGGYNTEDGDRVLKDFDFDNYDKNNSFWIILINMCLFAIMSYVAMRPEKSKLIRKDNINTPSAASHTDSGIDMEVPLMPSPANDKSASVDMTHELAYPERNILDTEWFRTSSITGGETVKSKGCRLVFRNLKYEVQSQQNKKLNLQLLKGVSGRAQPGEMTALMGASGAGKTTLLDVLAGRKTTGEISGDILFNGSPRTMDVVRSSAYVMQDNVHIGCLTVRQTLRFAANLRMPEKQNHKNSKEYRIDEILGMLGLKEVADSFVGNVRIRGISGGQLKRLSIGVEIINLPDLIFLDEPTTGLDSAIAYEVMSAVRNIANQNRTIVSTIHQPSTLTFGLFDKLLLLGEGRVVYFGPSKEAVNYFYTSPYKFNFVQGSNPADYVISVAGSFTPASTGKTVSAQDLATYYLSSDYCRLFNENIDVMMAMDLATVSNVEYVSNIKKSYQYSEYVTSTYFQVKTLFHRVALKTAKEPKLTIAAIMR